MTRHPSCSTCSHCRSEAGTRDGVSGSLGAGLWDRYQTCCRFPQRNLQSGRPYVLPLSFFSGFTRRGRWISGVCWSGKSAAALGQRMRGGKAPRSSRSRCCWSNDRRTRLRSWCPRGSSSCCPACCFRASFLFGAEKSSVRKTSPRVELRS